MNVMIAALSTYTHMNCTALPFCCMTPQPSKSAVSWLIVEDCPFVLCLYTWSCVVWVLVLVCWSMLEASSWIYTHINKKISLCAEQCDLLHTYYIILYDELYKFRFDRSQRNHLHTTIKCVWGTSAWTNKHLQLRPNACNVGNA